MISLILVAISIVPLMLGNDLAKLYTHIIFLVFAIVGAFGCYRDRDLFLLVTPNALIFFYTSLSIAGGAWGFANGYVLSPSSLSDYNNWQFADVALTTILLLLTILLSIDFRYQRRYRKLALRQPPRCDSLHLIVACFLLPFFFISLDLAFLGGSGDFSVIVRSVFAIVFILYASKFAPWTRWALYLSIIVLFATFSIDNKRDAILLVLPMLYVELLRSSMRLTWKAAGLFTVLAAFLLLTVLGMSVARGYGGFGQMSSLFAALPYIFDYVLSDMFVAGLLNNIEVNYFFFHAVNSIEMILLESEHITFGATIIKPLFIAIPRSVISWKPESMITLYTLAYDPEFRAIGGSWPISFLSELFWNFSYFAIAAIAIVAVSFAKLQFLILRAHRSGKLFWFAFLLLAYKNVLMLARGSGIDIYVSVQVIAGIVVFMCILTIVVLRWNIRHQMDGHWQKGNV